MGFRPAHDFWLAKLLLNVFKRFHQCIDLSTEVSQPILVRELLANHNNM
jgi:hypothetical protein